MTALQVFAFGRRQVRTAGTWDAPLFRAEDVCAILDLGDVSRACERLEQDEVELIADPQENSHERVQGGRRYKRLYVTESGLFALILGSRKPDAKAFRKWVTAEVLPEIRKRGYYNALEVETRKQTERLLAECFPNAPTKARPIFSDLIKALLEMRGEERTGNPPWAPLLASLIYEWSIPLEGQQAKRRELNSKRNASRPDHSMLSEGMRSHVIDVARVGAAFAKTSLNWATWRANMETAFRNAPLQLSLINNAKPLPARKKRSDGDHAAE